MRFAKKILSILVPEASIQGSDDSSLRYRRLWRTSVTLIATFCLLPLIIMTIVNYSQYQRALQQEMIQPIYHLTSNVKRGLEFFLEERRAALDFIVKEKRFEELSSQETLASTLTNLKQAFPGFTDLGLIDSTGRQRAYAGPYELLDKNYADAPWFHEVSLRGIYVSDMFTGYRDFPHFVIAVKHEEISGNYYVIRATIDMLKLDIRIHSLLQKPTSDAFLINRKGVLQTPSQYYGDVLEPYPLPMPPLSDATEIQEISDPSGNPCILAYSYINESPFIFMLIAESSVLNRSWFALRRKLLAFLVVSSLIILVLIVATSTYMVSLVRQADQKQAVLFHEMEYTNKMASIGRLASGVAHEINNPLAIINEKAGLLKDLLAFSEEFPQKERIGKFADSIITSVERCRTITHRLLGFAKHMDLQMETVNLAHLIPEVLGFLEKEASYRGLSVNIHTPDDLPMIQSDRGQLQQVFLNIVNNAFAAVDEGGKIDIDLRAADADIVSVTISDNGCGISEESLKHIFEPFFTTKGSYGTGLGLSITYGIVSKLGGRIDVESQLGRGTSFIVTLPINRKISEH
ncbi:MAG: ATP-binding protein [bacterium]